MSQNLNLVTGQMRPVLLTALSVQLCGQLIFCLLLQSFLPRPVTAKYLPGPGFAGDFVLLKGIFSFPLSPGVCSKWVV